MVKNLCALHLTTELKKDSREFYTEEKKDFLSFCELWPKVFVSYGQRYDHNFFILCEDL